MARRPVRLDIPSPELDRARPLAPQLYAYLRAKIVDNSLPPGARVSEAALSRELAVSRTPLRAALQQLAGEGLLEIRPQIGTAVAPSDEASMLEALFVRVALETAVVARLAEERAELRFLGGLIAEQRAAAEADDYAAFFELDERFHERLAIAAGAPSAWRLVHEVKGHVDRQRYRLMSRIRGRSMRAFRDHLAILDAIGAGAPAAAADEMRRHVRSVLDASALDPNSASAKS